MERLINFELTVDDYLDLKSVLDDEICSCKSHIILISRNSSFDKENSEYLISCYEKKIKSYTALIDKLDTIYMSYFL